MIHEHRIHWHRYGQDHLSPGCIGRAQQDSAAQEILTLAVAGYTANLPASLIGLEACTGSHFMGAALREQGHQVRLIPAQFVKPYRKSNKNDFIDAEAIAEAVTKQNMRFVQIKTQEQLDWQAVHRVRDRLVQRRTALINQIRGFLLECGITFPTQPIHLRKNLPTVIEDAEQNLSPRLRWLLTRLWQEWKQTEIDIKNETTVGWISRKKFRIRSRENFFLDIPFYRTH
jgi:transposase